MMKSKRLIGGGLCVMALAGLLVVTGCGNGRDNDGDNSGGAVKVANTVCPMMNKKLPSAGVAASLVRDYKGQKIGFCCAGCPDAWDKLSDAKKDAALEKADKPSGPAKAASYTCSMHPQVRLTDPRAKCPQCNMGLIPVSAGKAGGGMKMPAGTMAMVINTKCPIMGNPVDPAKVPANLVREFGGKKVGFCCAGCPAKWDKLPDAKKTELMAKLAGGKQRSR